MTKNRTQKNPKKHVSSTIAGPAGCPSRRFSILHPEQPEIRSESPQFLLPMVPDPLLDGAGISALFRCCFQFGTVLWSSLMLRVRLRSRDEGVLQLALHLGLVVESD